MKFHPLVYAYVDKSEAPSPYVRGRGAYAQVYQDLLALDETAPGQCLKAAFADENAANGYLAQLKKTAKENGRRVISSLAEDRVTRYFWLEPKDSSSAKASPKSAGTA